MTRYTVTVDGKPTYSGDSWRRARAVFESLDRAELVINGYLVASRVDGSRVRIPLQKIA